MSEIRKFTADTKKPIEKQTKYLKYGFVITEFVAYHCPRCAHMLNAGPDYQPRYCDKCGQEVTFEDIQWIPDKKLGYTIKGEQIT